MSERDLIIDECLCDVVEEYLQGPPGPKGDTGDTGAAGADGDVDGANETEDVLDATAGGSIAPDVSTENVFIITADDTAFTVAPTGLPAAGNARGITLVINFTAALPTITWPSLANSAPDISGATATTGKAVIEMLYVDGAWWAWLVEAI